MRWIAAAACLVSSTAVAEAAVERFAIIAGNDTGARDEANLRFAEADARKVADVLLELGGVPPENMVLLAGRDAAAFRRALIAMNDRIRRRTEEPGVEPLLFVYYSGHADARALHPAGTELDLAELEQLVRGSAAKFRILVLDACRSGSLTQVKGGVPAPPFALTPEERLPGEGVVFLTSSSATEDAQESDEIGGSFFTHYLVSGLLGAADADANLQVGLREAYAYAYDHTLRASSRTLAGMQHPTFNVEARGRGDLTITDLRAAGSRGVLSFPGDRGYIVLSGSETGAVVAEIAPGDSRRGISVRPGRYFLRSRARDHLLEGQVAVAAGEEHLVREDELERIAYARLVRKGRVLDLAHGPVAGYRLRTPLWSGASACHGAFAGYAIDLEWLTLAPRAAFCRSSFANDAVRAEADEIALELRAARVFDLPIVSIELGLEAGAALLRQTFATGGIAPDRLTAAAQLGAALALSFELPAGLYATADLAAVTYVFREQDPDGTLSLRPALTARSTCGLGKRW